MRVEKFLNLIEEIIENSFEDDLVAITTNYIRVNNKRDYETNKKDVIVLYIREIEVLQLLQRVRLYEE